MTIGYILSHVYKYHVTIPNPNSLVGSADASLLQPLSPAWLYDSCGARLLLEVGRSELLDSSRSHGPARARWAVVPIGTA
jgi:hypothetical protein